MSKPTRDDYIRRAEIEIAGDRYILAAAAVYDVPPEKVTPEMRQGMKEVMFAENYGADNVRHLQQRLKVSRESAIRFREKIHEHFPAIRKLQEDSAGTGYAQAGFPEKRGTPTTEGDHGKKESLEEPSSSEDVEWLRSRITRLRIHGGV